MRKEAFEFTGFGGIKLPAALWLPDDEAKAVIQIVHGMTEHIGRYEAFAAAMTAHGVAVAGYDLRGHGQNAGRAGVASFGEAGWEASLEDISLFFALLGERFPDTPHYMLGFSLGSFLLREILGQGKTDAAGAIIMGTGHQPSVLLSVMMAIVKGQIKKGGFDDVTDLVRQLSFGAYNQKFKPNRTASDWLCADETQLDAYIADPLCRKDISSGLFWQLLAAMKRTGRKGTYDAWKKEMPVLLLSGKDDPVGGAGKGVEAVQRQMKVAGLQRVEMRLIPGARHAVLDERASGAAEAALEAILTWMTMK